ncbi:cytochrome P450 9e2-like [Pseudomyrmex gracilis]|uniref:cytochrome P450 9e2-like n=1 Tax=Pseudomyrmex gracilis TaxID=219809 RepID=UPI000995088D|nr:cytochrome P450 9e2-like [Pseudomyrmex gracilis]
MMYILAVLALTISIYYFTKNINHFKKHGIPYIQPLPVVGNMGPLFFHRQAVSDFVQSFYNAYPDAKYIGVYDLTKPVILIRDLELVKSVMVKNFNTFMDHIDFVDETLDPLIGNLLIALRGEKWREVRSVLSPAFTSSKMKNMFKLMSECGIDFCDYLRQLSPENRMTDMKDVLSRYTNDVIATCAFGIKVDSLKNPNNDFYVYGKEAITVNLVVVLKSYLQRSLPRLGRIISLKLIRDKVVNFFRSIVNKTVKSRDANGIVRPNMLQLMMDTRNKESKTKLTIDDMVSQAFIFFFGGFETTSSTMCFVAYEIAVNQDVQEKLQSEIDRVLEVTNGEASYEAINSMEYLDAVVNETLRKYPIGRILDRLCAEDFELPSTLPGVKPYTVRKGQGVWIPVYAFHHDHKYFDEPSKFNPERFLGERKKESLNSGAYFPFGLGPRMCIGNRFALLETKVLFFHLLARCDLKPCEKTSIPLKMSKQSFNMEAEGGIWLNVTPRETPHRTISEKTTL